MDWQAFSLSLKLAGWTTLILLVTGLLIARALAWRHFPGKSVIEAVIALPLVLPPTVLGLSQTARMRLVSLVASPPRPQHT